jgi:hypothetical protein
MAHHEEEPPMKLTALATAAVLALSPFYVAPALAERRNDDMSPNDLACQGAFEFCIATCHIWAPEDQYDWNTCADGCSDEFERCKGNDDPARRFSYINPNLSLSGSGSDSPGVDTVGGGGGGGGAGVGGSHSFNNAGMAGAGGGAGIIY